MRLVKLRVMKRGAYLFIKKVYSTSNNSNFSRNYDEYEELVLSTEKADEIFSHKDFSKFWYITRKEQLIPNGWRGDELRFLISNRFNSKRY